ncbi:preprotein translocase subunit SecY [Convivina intestini]|uniref:Protein translocase subunit SecY n=1 Tax=Convivina intestini TaxID=1505726 RepID=A0A2U1D7C6_9LACO|nr:preprotein translocase subunit SecY [Convivina intestini]PVY83432.1 protein translocase subunit secY/sec61 alpha [Convivina intestini]CAH1854075.1 Protein translocase subunit SecY [Convivina intestini]CAH1855907.1 Protein translocase subunit SecY [Convivina intestini]SDC03777.1 protein translocase subunit secY/sec61 alpha [Leuconostocaceae bacterium R-53105]
MLSTLFNAVREKDIRKKLGWTILILFVYRIGIHITVPGVNPAAMNSMASNGLLNILNIFSGGGLLNFSLFAMGVSPYVTAQIVVQLLQLDIVPRFVEWSKQGEVGRRKLNNATRWLTIVFAFLQSIGITAGFNSLSAYGLVKQTNNVMSFVIIGAIMTIGTFFAVWLGEMITEKGLGNGVSMIIFAGIISQIPDGLYEIYKENVLQAGSQSDLITGWVFTAVIIAAIILVVGITTWFYEATRRLQIQYTRSAASYGSEAYLPLKLNVSGVIPVIFASSFISTPQTILFAFQDKFGTAQWYKVLQQVFSMTTVSGAIFYTVLIIIFTYFYAFVQVNPEKLAENLQKQGAYIVNVRPGLETQKFITAMLLHLSFVGALFLGFVALVPLIASDVWGLNEKIGLGGTSLLITIGVTLDLIRQIEGLIQKKNYVGFIQ